MRSNEREEEVRAETGEGENPPKSLPNGGLKKQAREAHGLLSHVESYR